MHKKRSTCRGCGGNRLRLFLSLGPVPLANSFLQSPDEFSDEPFFPLDVYFCETCFLVQLLDVINPEILFRNYMYMTGTSETIASHNTQYAYTIAKMLDLDAGDLIIEVASNDGSLLKCFKEHGVKTFGIEPATNIAAMASASGIDTINRFFDSKTAQEIRGVHGPAKAVIGNNVLAHVDDTQDFLQGCKRLLHTHGLVVIEVPYLADLVNRLEYDTIYHEHICYFCVGSLMPIYDKVGLSIIRVDRVPVHGGSLRVYAGPREKHRNHAECVLELAELEREEGLTTLARFETFAKDVASNRRAILNLLGSLKNDHKTIAGYGAPAKGNTLLNYCGIDTYTLPFTVDKSPMKVGFFTPGTHIPILPVTALLESQPDYVLILAWNFADEIMKQQHEYRDRGGNFIIPVPEPKVL
jgi:hypothetical protein